MPLYANFETKRRVTFRMAFDWADAGFLCLLTVCSFIAVTIGGGEFCCRALLFLLAMNASSLTIGRALLTLEIRAFRRFAEYLLGFAVCSLIIFAVCRAFLVSAGIGAGVAGVAGVAAAWVCGLRDRTSGGTADLPASLLVCVASLIWSWQAVIAVPHLQRSGVFDAWSDYSIHAGEVAQFAQFGALHGTSIFAAGADVPLYHYGSYMAVSALCAVSGLPALVCATVFWTLQGFLLLGLGGVLVGGVLEGGTAGLCALIVLLLLPDPAHTWPRNPFFDYHWLMQISPGSSYATALACLAVAAMVLWLRGRRTWDLAWVAVLSAAVFEFRVQVFAILALTNALMFVLAWKPSRWWKRPLLVVAGGVAVAGILALIGHIRRATNFYSAQHHPIQEMETMLGMLPNPYEHLYPRLIESFSPHGCISHALWVTVVMLAGYVMVAAAAFGALLPMYLVGLGWLVWRHRAAPDDYYPLAAVSAYGIIIATVPNTSLEPLEFAHRPFVLAYAMLAIWCGRYALVAATGWMDQAWRRRTALAAGVLLLSVPLRYQSSAQCSTLL